MRNVEVLDSTRHKTNIWLNEVAEALHIDNRERSSHRAYRALRGVLHVLRDHLTLEEVAQLSAQLPILVRGVYFEGWNPTGKPLKERSKEAFLSRVEEEVRPAFEDTGVSAEEITKAVFGVLNAHISQGELDDIRGLLPKPVRELWLSATTQRT